MSSERYGQLSSEPNEWVQFVFRVFLLKINKQIKQLMNLRALLEKYKVNREGSDVELIKKILHIRRQYFKTNQRHSFYLIPFSTWPLFVSFAIMATVIGLVLYMHAYKSGLFVFLFGFMFLIAVVYS